MSLFMQATSGLAAWVSAVPPD